MNMCVHSSGGVSFYNSIEESDVSHTEFIFKWVDKCIQKIGTQFVVQVVTDNYSMNTSAKSLLKEKRSSIFWTVVLLTPLISCSMTLGSRLNSEIQLRKEGG